MHFSTRSKILIALLSILSLSACGGGGGGGTSSTTTSNSTSLTINGIAVPADPGASGTATVAGVDTNHVGVRDEVQRALATQYGASPTQYDGAVRAAKALQTYLIANGSPSASTSATSGAVVAGGCLFSRFNSDAIAADRASANIFALTINTAARLAAYRATLSASTETSTPLPNPLCQ